ncbi:hypothetical protein Taro_050564 [Colocasia esculenta]|uniref:Uncharacterized protein n=1 Tax=Colocasia esculenta TaxID=4460 RepID=A0A843XE96_COLES|nr:hypothetical protein [Colocasia esculenta]
MCVGGKKVLGPGAMHATDGLCMVRARELVGWCDGRKAGFDTVEFLLWGGWFDIVNCSAVEAKQSEGFGSSDQRVEISIGVLGSAIFGFCLSLGSVVQRDLHKEWNFEIGLDL